MQIRCSHCHKPFAMSKDAVYAALNEMAEQDLSHYNVICPHCRRANRVSRDELHRAAPGWGKAVPSDQTEAP